MRCRRWLAFTLTEVLVALAILALITAVVVPAVLGRLEASRADAIVSELRTLENGLQLFRRDVGRYPQRLDYLNVLPTSGGVFDLCDAPISAPNQDKFRGPYISRSIVMVDPGNNITKYVFGTGDTIESKLRRTTIVGAVGTQQVIQILVYGPEATLIDAIDTKVDGVVNNAKGTVQSVDTPAPDPDTLKWTFPIKNGAC